MVVFNSFEAYMFTLSRTARWCQYLISFAFLSFFWGCQKSVTIAILKIPSGSIFLNSWLRCYRSNWWVYFIHCSADGGGVKFTTVDLNSSSSWFMPLDDDLPGNILAISSLPSVLPLWFSCCECLPTSFDECRLRASVCYVTVKPHIFCTLCVVFFPSHVPHSCC